MNKIIKKLSILFSFYIIANYPLRAEITNSIDSSEFKATDAFIKGNDASMRGDINSAIKYFSNVVELRPINNYLKRKLSIEYIKKGELEKAEVILEKIVNENSYKDYTSGNLLAGIYLSEKKPMLALMTYKKLILQCPDFDKELDKGIGENLEENLQEACEHIAKSFASKEEFTKDSKIFKRCDNICKTDATYKFYRGKIEYELGKYKSAKNYLKNALELDHSLFQAALVLGVLHEEKKQPQEAIKTYKNFLAKEGNENNIPILTRLVQLLFSSNEKIEVIKYAETLSQINNTDLNLKVRLGIIYAELGKNEKASKIFNEILKIVPDSDKVVYYLGAINEQNKNYQDAIKYLGRIPASSEFYKKAEQKIKHLVQAMTEEKDHPKK
jgi:tetratricopeptide (TPR) repeat protein